MADQDTSLLLGQYKYRLSFYTQFQAFFVRLLRDRLDLRGRVEWSSGGRLTGSYVPSFNCTRPNNERTSTLPDDLIGSGVVAAGAWQIKVGNGRVHRLAM